MPFYQKRGEIPNKRHIQFRDKNKNLYYEELISRQGFSSLYSNTYHINPPTIIKKVGKFKQIKKERAQEAHRHHHIRSFDLKSEGDAISSRLLLFYNDDVDLSIAKVDKSMKTFYRNGHNDEIIFIQRGSGSFYSNFGNMKLKQGDYVIIPRGIIWKMKVEEKMSQFIIETSGPVETPTKYRNSHGQLLEHSPYSERDIRTTQLDKPTIDGPSIIKTKLNNGFQEYEYSHHPFDIIGWDGYYYPWILNIDDFMPITGKIHQPPPVHQTFQAPGLVVCSFVPRMFDYHPEAIPAPYAHSNIDSDEILFYAGGEFMSRNNIQEGSITFHPSGLPHGPHPGKIEESIGKEKTNELAVMVDTFKPLSISAKAKEADDIDYPMSWKK